MKTSLRQLQVFVLTARHQNISIAAQEACISQAAASMSLSQFEKMLGEALFDRKSKRLVLNSLGKQLLPKAHSILQQMTELEQLAAHSEMVAGNLHIGASTTIANYVLPNIVNEFWQAYPQTNLQLSALNTEKCIEQLLNFEIDIALIEGMYIHPKIQLIPWKKDKLVLFCHPQHPLLQKKTVDLPTLAEYPWILREPESGTRHVLESALQQSKLNLMNITLVNSSQAIKNIIKTNSNAISCLSEVIVHDDIQHKKLVPLSVKALKLERYFYHAYYTESKTSKLAELFIKFIEA